MEATEHLRVLQHPGDHLSHPDPAIRRLAVAALAATEDRGAASALEAVLAGDESSRVRAEAAEALGFREGSLAALIAAAPEADAVLAEAIATALGRLGSAESVRLLMEWAGSHADGLVREAAVAALGAIGDPTALPLLLELVGSGPPQVRRRTVAALTMYDGPDVEEALVRARSDRNPMVREAAEMVVGRPGGDDDRDSS